MDLTRLNEELRRRGSRWADMVRVTQEVRLPSGILRLITVGGLESKDLPQVQDLEEVKDACMAAMGDSADVEAIFLPDILRIQVFRHGGWSLYAFLLGSTDRGIFPNAPDLENLRELVGPSLVRLGMPPTDAALFYDPCLEIRLGRGTLDFHLGDLNFEADDEELADFRKMIDALPIPKDLLVGIHKDGG